MKDDLYIYPIEVFGTRQRGVKSTVGAVWVIALLAVAVVSAGTVIGHKALTDGPGSVVESISDFWKEIKDSAKGVDRMIRDVLKTIYEASADYVPAEVLDYFGVADRVYGVYTGFKLLAAVGAIWVSVTVLRWFKSLIPGLSG